MEFHKNLQEGMQKLRKLARRDYRGSNQALKNKKLLKLFNAELSLTFLIIAIIIAIINSEIALDSWTSYNNGNNNPGRAEGSGEIKISLNKTSAYYSTFQPLTADLDGDGNEEIVLFSNMTIRVMDYNLNLIDKRYAGKIQGQPALFNVDADSNIEIVVLSKIDDADYLSAYEFGNPFKEEFKIMINGGSGVENAGVRCLEINENKKCIFVDNGKKIHIVDTISKIDLYYSTDSAAEGIDKREIIPSIDDIDNDGSYDAVFWLDNNSDNIPGIATFDVENNAVKWIADNIFETNYIDRYRLEGHPVIADTDGDGKKEIAVSVYYIDSRNSFNDFYTELFVYSSNGSRLFRDCLNPSEYSPHCGSGGSILRGSNPFIMDYNNDGKDEICLIKHYLSRGVYVAMAINCYDSSGALVNASVTGYEAFTAVSADMDNDGKKDVITEKGIFSNDGSLIAKFNYEEFRNLPLVISDIDSDGKLDLIYNYAGIVLALYSDNNAGRFNISDVQIYPKNPSEGDNLECSYNLNGRDSASISINWEKNGDLFSSAAESCASSTKCKSGLKIPSSELRERDVWKCSVYATSSGKKSLGGSDSAVITENSPSEWKSASKDAFSYGISSGKGYFSGYDAEELHYQIFPIKLQPLVADVDNDGQNEVVVFHNTSISILDNNLIPKASYLVGSVVGQYALENLDEDQFIEIIAIINGTEQYTFNIWQYDGKNFTVESSFGISKIDERQSIKCIDFDNNERNECLFADYDGIVRSYEIDAKSSSDDRLGVDIGNGLQAIYGEGVMSFFDIDGDGKMEALVSFSNNLFSVSSDKTKRKIIETEVNGLLNGKSAIIDAKAVNIDNAGEDEIAVAYRNDLDSYGNQRTIINLALISLHGEKILNIPFDFKVNCINNCIGFSSGIITEDTDNDGYNEVGMYLEGASQFGKKIMLFGRNGKQKLISVERPEENDVSASLADMDNDGFLDIILGKAVYNFNGKAIFNTTRDVYKKMYSIPVDIDKDGALDILWSNISEIVLFRTNVNFDDDLSITKEDVSFSVFNKTKDEYIVTARFHNNGLRDAKNVKVSIMNQKNLGRVEGIVNINSKSFVDFSAEMQLKKGDIINAEIDYDSSIKESDETNNFAVKEFESLPSVFIHASETSDKKPVYDEIKEYIKSNLRAGYVTDSESFADITIILGKDSIPFGEISLYDKTIYRWGIAVHAIEYNEKVYEEPYAGIVASYSTHLLSKDVNRIAIFGNSIEGDIAAAKEFIKRQYDFIDIKSANSFLIDQNNQEAVKVYDYIHLPANSNNYKEFLDYSTVSDEFKNIIRNALNDRMITIEDKTVVSENGITLRLRNLKPELSDKYLDALRDDGIPVDMPVVLARGLWSNLSSWENFGTELANSGRNVWLIEITGGPGQDCDDCVDYTFDELTDYYVPALLNGVLDYTGSDKLQYVGFSNGCRATLSSLEKNRFDSAKIDTFVAVGCPGAFNGSSLFGECLLEHGDDILNRFVERNLKHPSEKEFSKELSKQSSYLGTCWLLEPFLNSEGRISRNLSQFYLTLIKNEQDKQPGIGLNLNKFSMIYGTEGFLLNNDNDYVVTENDELSIFNNVISTNKYMESFKRRHNNLPDDKRVKNSIRGELK